MEKIILIAYGVFLIIGGLIGFKKGSQMSLMMGAASGLLFLAGVWFMTINARGSWIFLSCLSGLLALTFLMRLIKTQTFMPSGMLLILTIAVLVYCLKHLK